MEHFCLELEREIISIKKLNSENNIGIWKTFHEFWVLKLYGSTNIIIKFCPFCGQELKEANETENVR